MAKFILNLFRDFVQQLYPWGLLLQRRLEDIRNMLKSNSPNSCELKNPNANQFYKFLIVPDSPQLESGVTMIYSWMRNRNTIEFLGIWGTVVEVP